MWEIYQDIASYLLQATSDNVLGKRKGRSTLRPNVHRTTSQLLHVRGVKGYSSQYFHEFSGFSFHRNFYLCVHSYIILSACLYSYVYSIVHTTIMFRVFKLWYYYI